MEHVTDLSKHVKQSIKGSGPNVAQVCFESVEDHFSRTQMQTAIRREREQANTPGQGVRRVRAFGRGETVENDNGSRNEHGGQFRFSACIKGPPCILPLITHGGSRASFISPAIIARARHFPNGGTPPAFTWQRRVHITALALSRRRSCQCRRAFPVTGAPGAGRAKFSLDETGAEQADHVLPRSVPICVVDQLVRGRGPASRAAPPPLLSRQGQSP